MTELTIPSRTEVHMPWFELMQALINDTPRRVQLIKESPAMDPIMEMRELRIMTLGGPRQCGKTEALLKIIKGRSDVRFSILSYFIPFYKARLQDHYLGKLFPIDLFEMDNFATEISNGNNPFAGVKILVTDNLQPHYQKYLEEIYYQYKAYFDEDFMVIHVIH